MGVGESKVTHRVTIFTGDKKGAGANNLIVCIFIFISMYIIYVYYIIDFSRLFTIPY